MKNTFTFIALFCAVSMNCFAEVYCVDTANELQNALSDADSNNESDLIKIAEGQYYVNSDGYRYLGATDFDLEISGGWSEFFGDPCGQQLPAEPFYATTINGSNNYRGLEIESGLNSDISISNLFFINGLAIGVGKGGAVLINSPINHTGKISLKNNLFYSNTAGYGSALYVTGDKTTLINNTFKNNHSVIGAAIELYSYSTGIYFINNTVLSSSSGSTGEFSTAGLYIEVSNNTKTLVANNIFSDNGINQLTFIGDGYKYLRNNNIDGTTSGVVADTESGNFSGTPDFWPSVIPHYYIPYYGSPLIDGGFLPPKIIPLPIPFLWDWIPPDFDIRYETRIQENTIDIGAFEGISEPPIFINGFEAL